MARLTDSVDSERQYLESLECNAIDNPAFNPPQPLTDCKVALISSAGLMRRGDANVPANAADYRSFGNAIIDAELMINHVSVNFDRSAFAEDVNTVFPRELLQSLDDDGTIAGASDEHYSFMGATAPERLQPHAEQLAAHLLARDVNTVCLLPV